MNELSVKKGFEEQKISLNLRIKRFISALKRNIIKCNKIPEFTKIKKTKKNNCSKFLFQVLILKLM